jgi:hypothetical protein
MTSELTKEQREALLFDLLKCFYASNDLKAQNQAGVFWLHFTDWYGAIDLDALIEQGLVAVDIFTIYQPQGDWRDYFPPRAYRLTPKGHEILVDPSRWISDGTRERANPFISAFGEKLFEAYSEKYPINDQTQVKEYGNLSARHVDYYYLDEDGSQKSKSAGFEEWVTLADAHQILAFAPEINTVFFMRRRYGR